MRTECISGFNYITYLFHSPLNESLSLSRKIINIIFHILTLCIPLLVYHVVSYCFNSEILNKFGWIGSSLAQHEISDKLAEECLTFAQNQLLMHQSNLSKCNWDQELPNCYNKDKKAVIYKPSNIAIEQMIALMRGPLWDHLLRMIINHRQDTWNQKKVLEAADDLMKISIAIYLNTEKDLKEDQRLVNGCGLKQVISNPENYQNRAIYYVWDIYSLIKAGVVWSEVEQALVLPAYVQDIIIERSCFGFFSPLKMKVLPNSFPNGKYQRKWREWYNSYCYQLTCYLESDSSFDNNKLEDRQWLPISDEESKEIFNAKDSGIMRQVINRTDINNRLRISFKKDSNPYIGRYSGRVK